MRTAQLDGAHVEYFRGIANPIGVKVGAAMNAGVARSELLDVARSRSDEPGRLDADPPLRRASEIAAALPPLIEAVRATGQARAVGLRPDARQHRDHGRAA